MNSKASALLIALSAFLFTFFISHSAQARGGPFGLGLIVGSVTGLSTKYVFSRRNAFDTAISWNTSNDSKFYIHGTYLWQKNNIFKGRPPADFYYGVGARIITHEDRFDNKDTTSLGARVAAGLRHMFRDPNFELFAEASVNLNLIPDTNFDVDVGIGARFYF